MQKIDATENHSHFNIFFSSQAKSQAFLFPPQPKAGVLQ